ncbi:hypothetical protein ACW0W9_000570 [Vibrio parahaemolyticus]|nr:hypothetical protein [Vibrio parahaemolyticus]
MHFRKLIENFFPKVDTHSVPDTIKLDCGLKIPYEDISNYQEMLSWSPNIFIILYSLLEYTDKYRLIVSPQPHFAWGNTDNNYVMTLSQQWSALTLSQVGAHTSSSKVSIPEIEKEINYVFGADKLDQCIYDLCNKDSQFIKSVFNLLLSIDELFSDSELLTPNLTFRALILGPDYNIADNKKKHGCVTLKTSVPQTGLTINNLTHNLTVIKPAVKPKMIINKVNKVSYDKKSYNVLFLPWPLSIPSTSFTKVDTPCLQMDDYFGFFEYNPKDDTRLNQFLAAIIVAIRRVGNLDLIVLPECAVSEKTFEKMQELLFTYFKDGAPSLLSGIYGQDPASNFSKNAAKLAFIGEAKSFDSVEQKKHHRWFLDKNQLRAYNLAGALDPGKKWWENISVDRRNLVTLHTNDGVRLCPLICEDLARQEPVAQSVRAIGPNLVISLLLDGPQLKGRWPGKYSAVLSDDPGSSVLSVTPLGMSLRSTGLGDPPSRGVALWSEPNNGSETLYVDDNGLGILLELEVSEEKMWTIDGRAKMKSVLRKKYHTTILDEYPDSKMSYLRRILQEELSKGV